MYHKHTSRKKMFIYQAICACSEELPPVKISLLIVIYSKGETKEYKYLLADMTAVAFLVFTVNNFIINSAKIFCVWVLAMVVMYTARL